MIYVTLLCIITTWCGIADAIHLHKFFVYCGSISISLFMNYIKELICP